jgi:putative two-component system response regulator
MTGKKKKDNSHLLIIDDEAGIREVLSRFFQEQGYQCTVVASAEEALEAIDRQRFAVSLTDIRLGGMSGMEFLEQAREKDPDLAIVMMTGVNDTDVAVSAMRSGAMDYVLKPFRLTKLVTTVEEASEKRRRRMESEAYQRLLEEKVEERTSELRRAIVEIGATYATTLESLCNALDIRDNETEGHSQRVSTYAVTIARQMDVSDGQILEIERGSLLHDIGKIGIPDQILRKTGPLTESEWDIMRRHPGLGHKMLRHIKFLDGGRRLVLEHHERWDGKGYPQGLAGEEISLGPRIFALVDAFDAITSHRPYREAQPFEVAEEEIVRNSGTQFDPQVVEAFLAISKEKWIMVRRILEATLRHVLDKSDESWIEESRTVSSPA